MPMAIISVFLLVAGHVPATSRGDRDAGAVAVPDHDACRPLLVRREVEHQHGSRVYHAVIAMFLGLAILYSVSKTSTWLPDNVMGPAL